MEPGDSLLLYTDGLTEAFDAAGEQYGTERLVRTAQAHARKPPAALVAACLADMHAFRGAAVKTDDVTVMAIRRQ
jgi:sigma-B regulation protein RsbU (phosphoserine phosphatase)